MRLSVLAALAAFTCGAHAGESPAYLGAADCRIANPHPVDGESASWNGKCKDGYASGPGALQWFKHGKPTERYEGMMAKGAPDGEGIFLYADESRYDGQWKEGKWHGEGVVAYTETSLLFARFNQGNVAGDVKRHYDNGDRYEGGWNDGPQGTGRMVFALGGSYRGQWDQGQPDGEGEISYPNGVLLKGRFNHGYQLGAAAQEQAPDGEQKKFAVLQDRASTGSHIARAAITGFDVPVNKGYRDLTPEQQRVVKDKYPILQSGDEPPYPLQGEQPIAKAFSAGAQKLDVQGRMRIQAMINEQGEATAVTVLESPDPRLTEFAGQVLLVNRFKPAVCAGKPCAMGIQFRYNFVERL